MQNQRKMFIRNEVKRVKTWYLGDLISGLLENCKKILYLVIISGNFMLLSYLIANNFFQMLSMFLYFSHSKFASFSSFFLS